MYIYIYIHIYISILASDTTFFPGSIHMCVVFPRTFPLLRSSWSTFFQDVVDAVHSMAGGAYASGFEATQSTHAVHMGGSWGYPQENQMKMDD